MLEELDLMVELVAPSNNLPMLRAAIAGGADALYAPLTGKLAIRTGRDFFSLDELREIIDLVHRAGKKVYAVTNGRIDENERQEYYTLSQTLADIGADGLVVGSLALVNYISQEIKPHYPAFKVIISSTLGAVSGEDAEFFRSLGADRIIIPRLHSIDDLIAYRKETQAELELFTHGLICPVMEGQPCTIPSLCYEEEADPYSCLPRFLEKGQKVQPPCTFYQTSDGKNFWKPTIQCDISLLDKIVAIGIDSIKVIPIGKTTEDSESVVRIWREALDRALQGKITTKQRNEEKIANGSPLTVDFYIRERCV